MYSLFHRNHNNLGTMVEVYIDYEKHLIQRQFKPNAITCNGEVTKFNPQQISEAFDNEVRWLKVLDSEWIPKTIDVNYHDKVIVQEYTHPDLLGFQQQLHSVVPDIEDQIIEMYKFFRSKEVYKRNGSLSNLTVKNGQLVAFDFKWAMPRPRGLEMEIKSYKEWLSKISSTVPRKLLQLL